MATVTKGRTFVSGETVTPTKLNDLVDNATIAFVTADDTDDSTLEVSGGKLRMKDAGITAAKLATDSVETAKIKDANVTAAKLASNAVETAKINDAAVTAAKINNGAVTAAKLDGTGGGSGVPPVYGCRAWVNFNGKNDTTGAASTTNTNRQILNSGNVTSVLRNGIGDYTLTFATAMPHANYSVSISVCGYSVENSTLNGVIKGDITTGPANKTASQLTIQTTGTAASVEYDIAEVNVCVFC